MEFTLTNTAPGEYCITFSEAGCIHQMRLNTREVVFAQLLLKSIDERLRDYHPGADIQPAWDNPNLN